MVADMLLSVACHWVTTLGQAEVLIALCWSPPMPACWPFRLLRQPLPTPDRPLALAVGLGVLKQTTTGIGPLASGAASWCPQGRIKPEF